MWFTCAFMVVLLTQLVAEPGKDRVKKVYFCSKLRGLLIIVFYRNSMMLSSL